MPTSNRLKNDRTIRSVTGSDRKSPASQPASVVLRARRGPRHVILDVEDDGPGLQTPDAPIFDAFFSTKEGGTGLGLAITHRIVTDHLGMIDVSSKIGKTTFRVTLPLAEAAEKAT